MGSDSTSPSRGSRRSPLRERLRVTAARRAAVVEDIRSGSSSTPIYYTLLGISGLIASFGLLASSPAVVIGAMLVSPLMTPIFGISLGLAGSHLRLLRNALVAEFGGVLLVVALGYLLGLLPLELKATPEILSRTQPNLLDLFVATLAGLAGCLAMIDERISPSLPGVAIATSLTPPLSACGVCLALGAYGGAWGAFLLFLANFLAMLAVATILFVIAGFVSAEEVGSTSDLLQRSAPAVAGLLVVTVLLTAQLVEVVRDRRTDGILRAVLAEQLRDEPNTTVTDVLHSRRQGRLEVLAIVRASRVLSPHTVAEVQDALRARLGPDVDLFFRCGLTKDVAATGSADLLAERTLDGDFGGKALSPAARTIRIAEQEVRDILVDRPDIVLGDVNLVQMPIGPVLVVSIQSSREPNLSAIANAERKIRDRTGNPRLQLLVRNVESSDLTSKGRVLLGAAHFGTTNPTDAATASRLEDAVRARISALRGLSARSVDAAREADGWEVRAEVVGPTIPSPGETEAIERALAREIGAPVALTIWARAEVIVTSQRYESAGQGTVHDHTETGTPAEGSNVAAPDPRPPLTP
jgi:uncharacterized hydrophobic protein (TIGR00271 family)